MPSAELISEQYRAEQAALHAKGGYGTASLQFGGIVSTLVEKSGAETLLDYGCGSMRNLAKVLNCDVLYQGYDPAIPAFSAKEPADLVVCIDVLEHIEPDLLTNVLTDLQSLTKRLAFLTVHTGPAVKTLSDGRNAHLIQEPPEWWFPRLSRHFVINTLQRMPNGFYVVCQPLQTSQR